MKGSGKLYKMSELCDITSSKRIYAADYKSEGVPFYRGKEIVEKHLGKLDVSTELFIDRAKFEQIRVKFGAPKAGDLLLTSVGTLGIPYVVRKGEEFYFKDGNLTWFRNFRNLDSLFLYYWLMSPQGREQLKKCMIGSSQPAYTITLLKEMEICLPDFPIQHKIAAILSAYDDLIENNNRRIKILEEMAQLIYREWFVKLRFPGHEKVRMVDSELGPIPEGWFISNIEDICERINSGGTPSRQKPEYWEPANIRWFKTKELRDSYLFDSEEHISEEGLEKSTAKIFPENSVVMAIYAAPTLGRLGIITKDSCFNQAMCGFVVKSDILSSEFLFLKLYEYRDYFNTLAQGAAQQNINVEKVRMTKVLVPSFDVMCCFTTYVKPIFEQIRVLELKNLILRRTRDLLLPKLISGELDVEDLDIAVGGD